MVSLSAGCSNLSGEGPKKVVDKEIEEIEIIEVEGGTKVEYAIEDERKIFGNLSLTEIEDIIDEIMKRFNENGNFEENGNLIIEEVFKEYGIVNEDQLNAAKNKIIITETR